MNERFGKVGRRDRPTREFVNLPLERWGGGTRGIRIEKQQKTTAHKHVVGRDTHHDVTNMEIIIEKIINIINYAALNQLTTSINSVTPKFNICMIFKWWHGIREISLETKTEQDCSNCRFTIEKKCTRWCISPISINGKQQTQYVNICKWKTAVAAMKAYQIEHVGFLPSTDKL